MEIFDSLHGVIEIDNYIKDIIDTIEFQRLRNIKQLGCCYYVFPGASHNRFEHSLGVYHLTKKYIEHLNSEYKFINDYEKKMLCIASIIHDMGHGPYSHLFDDIVNKDKFHEYRSIEIFKQMNEKYNYGYCEKDIKFIYEIIKPTKLKYDKKYIYQIVSNKNGIDVDRFDYLMRDIKMIGLNYGIEYDRIMKKSKIMKNNPEGQMEIVYSDKIKTHIEDFYRIRYIMYKEIYNHKTVRIIEYMIKEYLKKIEKYHSIKKIINEENWIEFNLLNDNIIDKIWTLPIHENIFEIFSIINNIKKRNIYKCIGTVIFDKKLEMRVAENEINHNIIIDDIKISYYGIEKCKFYNENEIYNLIKKNENKDEYIYSIYYKHDLYKEKAQEIFIKYFVNELSINK